ncbi:uncharacterized protein LACBIDRAFT_314110 [Laccaria bicolor S238N-H82]|uniref:Predicted protein n=1 Tax=Laccaria bicolor (strain S238N-H82 / ATCC MYA-4686) TaxID=486041 RepID=B0D1L9_LACBS|nr:uncharacterized protein LACBIDRAFT_314110 [Laccaria bicolor S238N-H82]EDR11663.1 predicted protein [Laccaria bicolor S238N-H82]|eukprot:XP_001877560.1 predicted protein [Laccaria bicolor S238N-H82]
MSFFWNNSMTLTYHQVEQALSVKRAGLDTGAACQHNTENKHNFVETFELWIGLKNYDPKRD